MSFRVVQKGASPVVVCYLVGSHVDPDLRAACPGRAIVATDKSGLGANAVELAAAKKLAGHDASAPVVLVGYSAGCQGVRSLLLGGVEPTHVLAIDGTHASIPAAAWQLDVWRKLAEKARRNECVFVGTCTNQLYTAQLPAGQRFMPSRTVLEAATGVTLEPVGKEHHDGGLHLHSYESKNIDKEAHIHQQRVVLPDMLRRYVGGAVEPKPDAPSLASRIASGALSAVRWLVGGLRPTAALVDTGAASSLGDRALAVAVKELGVRETPGPGSTKRVSEYLSVCVGRPERGQAASGKLLGLSDDSNAWCAAFASWCMLKALQPGDKRPHEPRAAVWELVADARDRGTWRDVSSGYRPKPGDLGIYKRAGGDPRIKGQSGHVDRVETVGADSFTAIGGNEGDMVKREAQRYDAQDVAGWIVV